MLDKITLTKEEFDKMIKFVNTATFNMKLLKAFMEKIEKGFEDTPL